MNEYYIRLGGIEVWVENWPYAYGNPYSPKMRVLPTMKTRKRLKKMIEDNKYNEIDRKIQKLQ